MKSLTESVKKENRLWLKNGKAVKNLAELYREMQQIDSSTFKKHVNEKKNDIYEWIKYNYNNKQMSEELLECATKEAMLLCLEQKIKKTAKLKTDKEIAEEIVKNIQQGKLPMAGSENVKGSIIRYNQKNRKLEPLKREEIIKGLLQCQ